MSRILGYGILLAASAAALAEEPRFEPLLARPGIVSEGWEVRDWADISKPPKWPVVWEVDADGVLYGTGRYSPGNSGDRWVGTWLLSQREYADFILELEFKFRNGGASGNGGVGLRTPLVGDPSYSGVELQITDPRFELGYFPNATAEQLTGALYLLSPAREQVYRLGQWNRYRVEMRGPKVKVELNGTTVQDIDLTTFTSPTKRHGGGTKLIDAPSGAARPLRGHIGLQDISENGEVILFRNIRIAELRAPEEEIQRFKTLLTQEALARADRKNGQALYERNCAMCHTSIVAGHSMGPPITAWARRTPGSLLTSIITPSAEIVAGYQLVTVTTRDDRTLSGTLQRDAERSITLRAVNDEAMTVSKPDIASRHDSQTSMMPEGLIDALSDDEVRDLVGFLAHAQP